MSFMIPDLNSLILEQISKEKSKSFYRKNKIFKRDLEISV